MSDLDDKKRPWFGPKRNGFGVRPTSWQGWAAIAVGLVLELVIINEAHQLSPSWFVAKVSGIGFNPATWQGWVAVFAPIVIFVAILQFVYRKQLGKQ
jgi:hypothetical protein